MKLEELISKRKDMYVVNKGREWMRKDFIKDLEELQSEQKKQDDTYRLHNFSQKGW